MLAVPTDANTVDGGTINPLSLHDPPGRLPAAGTVDLDLVVHGDGPKRAVGHRRAARLVDRRGRAPGQGRPRPRRRLAPVRLRRVGLGRHRGHGRVVAGRGAGRDRGRPRGRGRAAVARRAVAADVYILVVQPRRRPAGPIRSRCWPHSRPSRSPTVVKYAYLSAGACPRSCARCLDWLTAHVPRPTTLAPKAYWRAGRANAPHGEPLRDT